MVDCTSLLRLARLALIVFVEVCDLLVLEVTVVSEGITDEAVEAGAGPRGMKDDQSEYHESKEV